MGRWGIPITTTPTKALASDESPSSLITTVASPSKEQKPLADDIPQATSARDLLATIQSGNGARSQARMYLAVERLTKEQLATMAREADVLARQDWRAWGVQSAIIARWTEIAPMEALTYAKALKGSNRANAFDAVFGQLATTNPSLAERQLASIQPRTMQRYALRALATGMADGDPRQGISLLERNGASANDYAFNEIASKWARRDPNSAASFAASLPPSQKRDHMINGVATAWASTDPNGALGWAHDLGDTRLRREAVSNVISSIAAEDPEEALSLVDNEPRHDQQGLRQRALGEWFNSDHEAAMAWINDRPNEAERLRLFYGSAYQLVWEDPEGAYKLVRELPDGEQKINFMSRILSQWSWNDPDAGLDWLKTFSPAMQGRLLGESNLWGLAEANPEGLREVLAGVTLTDNNKRAFHTLGNQYVDRDPAKALEWVKTIESPSAQADVLAEIYRSWAYREPDVAADEALSLTDPDQRRRAVESIASSWANSDPEKAMEWAEGLSGKARDQALASVIQATASEDPIKASQQVDRLLSEGTDTLQLASAAASVASSWTESNPQAAANWASELSSDKARKDAVGRVAGQWAQFDPLGASEWIGNLANGPERDAAASQLAQNIRATDPEAAFAWAATIQDERDRFQALEQTVSAWKNSNESAARNAILAADMSQPDQAKLLEKLGETSSQSSSHLELDPFAP